MTTATIELRGASGSARVEPMTGRVRCAIIGALAANLIGRTLITAGESMLDRTPIVRSVYKALKQIFESVVTATGSRGLSLVGPESR